MTHARIRRYCGTCVSLLVPVLIVGALRARAAGPDDASVVAPLMARPGEKRAEITKAVLNVSALQPGKPATIAVVLEIKPGFHAQSRTPSQEGLIPFNGRIKDHPSIKAGAPVYPKGEDHDYGQLGKLNVYLDRVTLRIPIEVKADAPLGATKIIGDIYYQLCDNNVCYPPERTPFTIDTEIVGADKAVQPNEPELFSAAAAAPTAGSTGSAGANATLPFNLLATLGLAFVVGIAFNIVPCVLPVLPLKALGFYEVSQHNRGRCILYGLAFSLGVVASFAVLGLFVIVLKTFTWGQIFSNTWFTGILALILAAMALNMFGLFTVNLPGGMYALSPRHDTYFGNVLYGILTAALSTPCTFGLFVGLLATIATQPSHIGMLIIVTVGAGMASPYVLLSAFPELARKFPRTGPWAEVVKQFMGFLLLAVAVFFAQGWVGRVVGPRNSWWVIFLVIAAGGVFLVLRSIRYGKTAVAPVVASVIALLLIVPSFYLAHLFSIERYHWEPFTPDALAAARASDKVVLIDFTADWCATCKTVEATVLNRTAIMQDVQKYKVRMIRADLTSESAPGWELLHALGGQGIPLTVIYSPNLKEPVQLPGLYSVKDLHDALARAAQLAPTVQTAAQRE